MSFYSVGQNIAMICFSLAYALLAGIFTLQQVYFFISIYGIAGGISFFSMRKICIRKRNQLKKTPKPGCMKGKIIIADDFDAPLDDFKPIHDAIHENAIQLDRHK